MKDDEAGRFDTDVVTGALVQRFMATIGRPAPRAADGEMSPHGLHWCLAPDTPPYEVLGEDGLPTPAEAMIVPPEGYSHTMWAGGEVWFHAPLRIGNAVRRRTRTLDVVEKEGRNGRLAFGRVQHDFSVVGDDRVTDVQNYVFRREGDVVAARPVEARPLGSEWDVVRTVTTSSIMLFRYSALTFNSHRIHYDEAYTTGVENFPGLVVHGPLTATLLIDACAERIKPERIERISFRASAPAFCGETLTLATKATGQGLDLIAHSSGRTIMSATATLRQ